ncbi:MAG TPA: hypothetical protein VF457_14295 [Burkholderiaceae bacterium]
MNASTIPDQAGSAAAPPRQWDLPELSRLAALHALAQGMPRDATRRILDGIAHADGPAEASWPSRWMQAGSEAGRAGDWSSAVHCFNLGRFPCTSDAQRARSHALCVAAARRWAAEGGAGAPVAVHRPSWRGRRFTLYVRRCLRVADPPLLLVLGGIVSVKEQWLALLGMADRLGVDVALTEFPGVGENELVPGEHAHEMIGIALDVAGARAAPGAFALALSFGGTLALRQAAADPRIKGIATIGAPVRSFFHDSDWFAALPPTTRGTLSHLLAAPAAELQARCAALAVREDELRRIAVPVSYVECRRDEIVQQANAAELMAALARSRWLAIDDVHGAPNRIAVVRSFLVGSIVAGLSPRSPRGRVAGTALRLLGALPGVRYRRRALPRNADPSVRTE